MISSEASASELAINSAITPAPFRHASTEARTVRSAVSLRTRSCKRPSPLDVPGERAMPTYYFRRSGGTGSGPLFSTHVYHILIFAANVKALADVRCCATLKPSRPGVLDELVRKRSNAMDFGAHPAVSGYQLSSASRSAIAIVIRSIMVSVVSSGCMFGNSGEWHSVIVHIASACTICCR